MGLYYKGTVVSDRTQGKGTGAQKRLESVLFCLSSFFPSPQIHHPPFVSKYWLPLHSCVPGKKTRLLTASELIWPSLFLSHFKFPSRGLCLARLECMLTPEPINHDPKGREMGGSPHVPGSPLDLGRGIVKCISLVGVCPLQT